MATALLPLWIGLRYNRSSNKQRFLSLLSWVSLLGMMLGVCALIVVLSVMNGFQSELRGRMLGLMAHGTVEHQQQLPLKQWPTTAQWLQTQDDIIAVAPLIGGDVMLSANGALRAGQLNGIDWQPEQAITNIEQHIIAGSVKTFAQQRYGIILGRNLAYALGLSVGDKVSIILPKMTVTPFGLKPRIKQFTLLAVFEVGADIDSSHAFINLASAQRLYGLQRATEDQPGDVLALRYLSKDVLTAHITADKLTKAIMAGSLPAIAGANEMEVISWSQRRAHLFQAVKMEKLMVTFMLSMVIAVAAFNLISVLSMMVADKRNEVSVLRMMGLSRLSILLVFLTQGLSLTLLSVVIGGLSGVVLASYLSQIVQWLERLFNFHIFDPAVFYISGLPSQLQLADVVYVVSMSLVLSFLFILYPAYRATKIKAVEALQYQ